MLVCDISDETAQLVYRVYATLHAWQLHVAIREVVVRTRNKFRMMVQSYGQPVQTCPPKMKTIAKCERMIHHCDY